MIDKNILDSLSKDQLIELLNIYSKNLIAMDGVWFQAVEKSIGMDNAMNYDCEVWKIFSVIEAKRIKEFLKLDDKPGLKGLEKALNYRYNSSVNSYDKKYIDNSLIYRIIDCRVQTARKRKNMDYHPCKSAGIIEYSEFAKTIDDRIECECLSCFPEINDKTCCCSWKFTLKK